jgi:uncharacterized protein YjiS (DUF1127 family)
LLLSFETCRKMYAWRDARALARRMVAIGGALGQIRRDRASRRELNDMSDRMLADIGLSRSHLSYEYPRPLNPIV